MLTNPSGSTGRSVSPVAHGVSASEWADAALQAVLSALQAQAPRTQRRSVSPHGRRLALAPVQLIADCADAGNTTPADPGSGVAEV